MAASKRKTSPKRRKAKPEPDPIAQDAAQVEEPATAASDASESPEAVIPEPTPDTEPAEAVEDAWGDEPPTTDYRPAATAAGSGPAHRPGPRWFRVMRAVRFAQDGHVMELREGSYVSDMTHDISRLALAGADLEPCDPPRMKYDAYEGKLR